MKRALTLTGAILGLVGGVFSTVWTLISVIGVIDMMSYSYYYGNLTGSLILAIIFFVVSLLTLIFSAVSIPAWNKTAEIYKKKKAMIITAMVFNFLTMILNLIILCVGMTGWVVIFIVLAMLLCLACAVIFIIDLCLENRRISKQGSTAKVAEVAVSNDAKLAAAEVFEKKLAKLNAMKEHGIISDEEYSEIKKSYVKEFLG